MDSEHKMETPTTQIPRPEQQCLKCESCRVRRKLSFRCKMADGMSIIPVLVVLFLQVLPLALCQGTTIHKSLLEEPPGGTIVANIPIDVNLDDQYSQEVLGQLQYSMVREGDHGDLFAVEKETGVVRTKKRVDRDAICPNAFDCEASFPVAIRSPGGVESVQLTITIEDRNDNAPAFPESYMMRSLSETTGTGVLFPIQEATDPDHPSNSTKTYQLVPSIGKFQLQVHNNSDTTGTVDLQLVLREPLDREDEEFYQLKVLAYDGGQPSRSGMMIIDIQVEDANDNNPTFENDTYTVEVPEDTPVGHLLKTLSAHDDDIGENGRVTYKLSTRTQRMYGKLFDLNPNTGDLTLKQELDYEIQNSYTLGISAEDAGTGSIPGAASVLVTVLDVNDHAPEITVDTVEGSGEVAIKEHSDPESFVAHISVDDPDGGDNGMVHCALNSSHFKMVKMIDKEFKILTVDSMDRERGEKYHIIFECSDRGTPPRSTKMNITVFIEDINDHKPVFIHQQYNATLYENNEWNAFVTEVKAVDFDSNQNGQIHYMLGEDSKDVFHVDPDTGRVTALVSFDREKVSNIEFHVIAADSSDDMKMSQCLVSLEILDRDDNPPMFEQANYVCSVSENLPARTSVGQVSASDIDLPPYNQFSYYLDLHNTASLDFSVDPNTGVVYTKRMLNREKISLYEFAVRAQTNAVPPIYDTCKVSVYVTDKNDNAPIIDFPSYGNDTVSMPLDMQEGEVVATVQAHDEDWGTNQVLFYRISEGNEGGEFIIEEPTGRVIVHSDPKTFQKASYELVILVVDSGTPPKFAVATLNIILQDSPYKPPVIVPNPGRGNNLPTGEGNTGKSTDNTSSGGLSTTHLAIVISVIAGCCVVALVLVFAIVLVRRKTRRLQGQTEEPDDFYWPKGEHGEGGKSPEHVEANGGATLPRDDSKMTEISQISDIILALDTEPMNYQSRVQQLQEHSPKSDLDGDSGCADLSNSGSQTSNEDSDGSKRSSKASDSGGPSELPLPALTAPRPQVLPPSQLQPSVPPMPLLQRRYSDRLTPPSHNPDTLSLQRNRYPYEEDSPLRRTYSTPPKAAQMCNSSHTVGLPGPPQGALAAARNLNNKFYSAPSDGIRVSTLPRSLSNCSKKSVRFTDSPDTERPETPKAEKHVHFADQEDVLNSSPRSGSQCSDRVVSPHLVTDMTESGYYEGSCSPSKDSGQDDMSIPLSSYPPDGTYTTFIPVKNSSLSSLV